MTQTNPAADRELEIELLALDLKSCTRCVGTLANIEVALETVQRALGPTGTTMRLRKTVVDSAEAARELRLVSSPTIRIAGRDIVFETRESPCESCSDLCGCSEGTSCRVWTYQGVEYTEAPVGLIVEALLREVVGVAAPTTGAAADYELPENLRRFFAGRAGEAEVTEESCCSPAELATCCAPYGNAACCDANHLDPRN